MPQKKQSRRTPEPMYAGLLRGALKQQVRQSRIHPQRREDSGRAITAVGLIDKSGQTVARKIAIRRKKRIDEGTRRGDQVERLTHGRMTADEARRHLRRKMPLGQRPLYPFDVLIARLRPAFPMGRQHNCNIAILGSGAQWLVPSEKLILFQTLYFPEGRDIGRRFTSANVAAS